MKYILPLNEYINPNKEIYLKWLSNAILKDVFKLNIPIETYDDIRRDGFSFIMTCSTLDDLKNNIKKVMRILKHWKKYCLEHDNLIIMVGYIDFEHSISAKFIIRYKTLKIKRIKPLKFIYHQTKKENIESILKNGLIPKDSSAWMDEDKSLEYPPAIFVNNISYLDDKEMFHSKTEEYIVLQINTTKIKNKWYADLNLSNDDKIRRFKPIKYIMTFEPIPPEAIRVINKQ